nr:hypothetical protein [Pseudomonas asgharzadehiana]
MDRTRFPRLDWAPWCLVHANGKKKARLNYIHYPLGQMQYRAHRRLFSGRRDGRDLLQFR